MTVCPLPLLFLRTDRRRCGGPHTECMLSDRWNGSQHFPPSKKYLWLIADLDRRQASIIFQLRMGHIGLNHHLFRIRKSDTLVCPNCQSITVETVKHFLLDCPFYQHERHALRTKLRCNSDSLSFLLSSPVAIKPVLKFVHATGCFKSHFGKNLEDRIPTQSRCNADLCRVLTELEKTITDAAAKNRVQ